MSCRVCQPATSQHARSAGVTECTQCNGCLSVAEGLTHSFLFAAGLLWGHFWQQVQQGEALLMDCITGCLCIVDEAVLWDSTCQRLQRQQGVRPASTPGLHFVQAVPFRLSWFAAGSPNRCNGCNNCDI
jgi:hypothetical protein